MEIETVSQLLSGYDTALFGSFFVSLLIIASRRIHLHYSSRGLQEIEVQRSHVGSTPRIGGLAIFFGCAYAWYNSDNFSSNYLGYIILSGIPVLLLGLLDDFYFKVSPFYRLMGAAISSIIAIFLLKTWLNRVDVFFVRFLFSDLHSIPQTSVQSSSHALCATAPFFRVSNELIKVEFRRIEIS